MNERTPYNGRPFYCNTCGAGFGEFMACDGVECELETETQAMARKAKHEVTANDGSVTE